jgi:hypothetical protein
MPAGSRTLLASGKRRISATGRRVLSNASGPCCCPACPTIACGPPLQSICDCVSADPNTICCARNTGQITVPFSTITPASGYESQPFAAVIDDLISEVSGQNVVFTLSTNNISSSFSRYGKIVMVDECVAATWVIDIQYSFGSPFSNDLIYVATIRVFTTNVGGPFVVGQPFPCTDENGTLTGRYNVPGGVSGGVQLAALDGLEHFVGDCCGPIEPIKLRDINTDYLDDEEPIEVGPYEFDPECSHCDNDAFPETVSFDLSQCFPGLPTVELSKTPGLGLVGLDYALNESGTTGIYYWEVVGLIVPQSIPLEPDEGCETNAGCCFAFQYFMQVWDETDPEDPILVQTCDVTAYKCDGRLTVVGTYSLDGVDIAEITETP